jgi:hypothetical protein
MEDLHRQTVCDHLGFNVFTMIFFFPAFSKGSMALVIRCGPMTLTSNCSRRTSAVTSSGRKLPSWPIPMLLIKMSSPSELTMRFTSSAAAYCHTNCSWNEYTAMELSFSSSLTIWIAGSREASLLRSAVPELSGSRTVAKMWWISDLLAN